MVEKIPADMRPRAGQGRDRAEVHGRAKKPLFDLAQRCRRRNRGFPRLSDIYGFRVITGSEGRLLSRAGRHPPALARRAGPGSRDYISQPKTNGYPQHHTPPFFGPRGGGGGKRSRCRSAPARCTRSPRPASPRMVLTATVNGVENRFAVRPPPAGSPRSPKRFTEEQDHDEFLDMVKLEMYQDQVFCFTPKGDVIKAAARRPRPDRFPPMRVHTKVGHACVGAKVDGIRVPLWTRLKNGQSVDIITAEGQTPQATWVDIAVNRPGQVGDPPGPARRGPRAVHPPGAANWPGWRSRNAARRPPTSAGHRGQRPWASTAGTNCWPGSRGRVQRPRGGPRPVIPKPGGGYEPTRSNARRAVIGLSPDQANTAVPHAASRCRASENRRHLPIAAKGVVVHAIDCERSGPVTRTSPTAGSTCAWQDGTHRAVHNVAMDLTISNECRCLARNLHNDRRTEANISDLVFIDRKPDYYRLLIEVDLRDVEHMHRVMTALEADSNVSSHRAPP